MRRLSTVLFLSTALITPAALAASPKPAPVAKLVSAVKLPYQEFTLDNGLRVVVHTDRKAPVVAVSVWYGVGSKYEPKGKTGFAHLFEHLMFGGSENVEAFDQTVVDLGGSDNNGTTDFDRTNYFQTVPTGSLDRMLFVEADRMGRLLGAISQNKLDTQRGVVQNEKRQRDNQPYGLAFYELLSGIFPEGHPYQHSVIGSMADLDAASLEDVRGWFRANYGPNNAVLVLAGDIDLATAKAKVQSAFGGIARGPAVTRPAAPVPVLAAPVTKTIKDQVANTRILKAWPIPGLKDKDAAALRAAGGVLGGLSSSRLDNALVREQKVAVSVSAGAELGEDVGFFTVQMDILPGTTTEDAMKRLDAVVNDFLARGPSADELRRVATQSVSGTISGLEAVGGFGGKAVLLAEGKLFSNNPGQVRNDLKAMAAVTPKAVKAVTQTWLMRPAFTLIIEPGTRDARYVEADSARKIADPEPALKPTLPLPPLQTNPGLDFPPIERAKLSNGIEVFLARRSTVPLVQVQVSFDAGYAADPRSALGTQALTLGVMDEGTTSRSSVQIAEESEALGTSISTGASMDRTSIGMTALAPNLAASLDLLADVVRNPAFAEAEVDRVRAQQLARISDELTKPAGLAGRVLPPVLWGKDHPYAVPGSGLGQIGAIKALTPTDLKAFHASWLRPEKARIFVAGDTTLKRLMPILEKSFGTWVVQGAPAGPKNFSAAIPAPRPRIILIDRPNSPQSVIMAGVVLGASGRDDLVTLRAANEVFGVGLLSRINADLRETKGWSYGVRSGIGGAEERVSFTISAPVQADRTGDSLRALRQHLADFTGPKGVTPEELTRIVNSNSRELPGSFESSGDLLSGVSAIINLGRPDDWYEGLAKKYAGMTTASLDATARAAINPANIVWVVVGDAKQVRGQLDGIGLPVEELPVPKGE